MKVEKKHVVHVVLVGDRIAAFKANGVEDPIEYIDNSVKKL